MTKHSTLTNPDDLHYAKVRTFSGNPASVVPDFVDELLIATDTKKIYRATSTATGGMVELSANQGNSQGNAVEIGNGIPLSPPTSEGQVYFNSASNLFYCSVNKFGSLIWQSAQPPIKVSGLDLYDGQIINVSANASGNFSVFHGQFVTSDVNSLQYESIALENLTEISNGSLYNTDLENLINIYGAGLYGFGYNLYDPDSLISSYRISPNITSSEGFSRRSVDFISSDVVTHLGHRVDGVLYVSPYRSSFASFSMSLSISDVS